MAFAGLDHLEPDMMGGPDPGREVGAFPELSKLRTWFRESEEAFWSARIYSERVRDYVDGKQWTDAEEEQLRKRGQSAIVFNRMRGKVNVLLGIERKLRMDPKAYPRTPQHDDEAELASDAIRYVCEKNDFDKLASMVFDQACCVEGEAGLEVAVEYRGQEQEPEIVLRFNAFDRTFRDPHSRMPDYSDARYIGSVCWMDVEQARARWPDAAEVIGQTITAETQTTGDTYEDAPRYWADRARNRVQVVKIHWRAGEQWMVAIFVGGGFVEEPMPSPYVDDTGASVPELELCSGYVSRQGERYGLAHIWIGPQDSYNKRHSKALHLLSTRQSVSDRGVFNDIRRVKAELAKPDGHVQKDGDGDFQLLNTNDMSAGNLALLQEAKAEIDQTGPDSADTAPGGVGNVSGVGIQSQQNAGMLEIESLLDNHRDFKLRVYRAIWARIRQFWRAPRWIRVTDDLQSLKWLGMNQPVTRGQMMMERAQGDPEMMAMLESMANDPRLQQIVAVQNQPAQTDVDLVIDEGPDVVTTAAQEFELVVRLWEADKKGEMSIEQVIEASNLRSKERLLEALRGNEEQRAQAAQEAAQAAQIQEAGVMAELQRTQADAAKTAAEAEHKRAQTAEIAAKLPADIELTEARADAATADAAKTAREATYAPLAP